MNSRRLKGWLSKIGVVVVGAGIIWRTIDLFFVPQQPNPQLAALGNFLMAMSGLGFLILAVTTFVHLCRRGTVVRRFGFNSSQWQFLGMSAAMLATGPAAIESLGIGGGVFIIAFACFWYLFSAVRMAICERGIWFYFALIPYDKIESVAWSEEGELLIRGVGMSASQVSKLPIPTEDHEEFERLLAERLRPEQWQSARG